MRLLRRIPRRGEQVASLRPPRAVTGAQTGACGRAIPRSAPLPEDARAQSLRGECHASASPGARYPARPRGRPPAPPACARCAVPTPLRGRAALASHARERGFLKADPVASAHRRSPVPRAHDAHFQGRRCHDRTETQQPDACLSSLPLASARLCSPTCGGSSRGPRPSRFSANGRGHLPPRSPGLRGLPGWTRPATPKNHCARLGWAALSAPPHPCPRHAGTCSSQRAPGEAPPTSPRASRRGCARA